MRFWAIAYFATPVIYVALIYLMLWANPLIGLLGFFFGSPVCIALMLKIGDRLTKASKQS